MEVSLLPQRFASELAEGTRKRLLSLVMLLGDIVNRKYPGVRHISGWFLTQKGRKLALRNYGVVNYMIHRADRQVYYL